MQYQVDEIKRLIFNISSFKSFVSEINDVVGFYPYSYYPFYNKSTLDWYNVEMMIELIGFDNLKFKLEEILLGLI
jgi:hypothetical protein